MKRNSFWALMMVLLLAACTTVNNVSKRNLSYRYNEDEKGYGAIQSVVFHTTDSFSTIFLRVDREVLDHAWAETEAETPHFAYELYDSYESRELLDSGTVEIPLEEMESGTDPWYYFELNVPTLHGKKYIFQISATDYKPLHHICLLDREWNFSQQDALLTDLSGEPLFDQVIGNGQSFRLTVRDANIRELKVRYYRRDFRIAFPPFAFERKEAFDFREDSAFTIVLESGVSPELKLDQAGIYHFQAMEGSQQGKTLYRYYEGFPAVTDPGNMLSPLRYLTTSKEFEQLQEEPDAKLAVDKYWLGQIGNVSRARVRIRDYYSRVEQANIMFTSYQEGWKTDRGMIYTIFGPPKVVYRIADIEKWVYGEAGNMMSLKFTFTRVQNPFTLNDYSLNRSPVYKESWYNAVESWRR